MINPQKLNYCKILGLDNISREDKINYVHLLKIRLLVPIGGEI